MLRDASASYARAADDELLAPLSAAERERFMGLLIRISGTEG
ncbi:hypothetical protein ACWD3I_17080 [Streptomyces sp. NPDC002817]